jgi:hypothetical protein
LSLLWQKYQLQTVPAVVRIFARNAAISGRDERRKSHLFECVAELRSTNRALLTSQVESR